MLLCFIKARFPSMYRPQTAAMVLTETYSISTVIAISIVELSSSILPVN